MGLFDEWKIKRECAKSGRKKEYDEYKKSKEAYITEKICMKDIYKKQNCLLKK